MNENKNILKLVIPVVAVIIILESVILVNNLVRRKRIITVNVPTSEVIVDNAQQSIDLVFATESKDMVVGKSYPVELTMLSSMAKSLDSIALYIKFDPSAFEVTGLSYDNKLPKANFSKVSNQANMIVLSYLVVDQQGYLITENNPLALAKFSVKPKKVGSFTFEVNTGVPDKESTTMFVENATGKILPYSSNRLVVGVK